MVLPALPDWDESILRQIAPPDENNALEKKAGLLFDLTKKSGKTDLVEEIAKQVSAFSNSGSGFLVVGIDNKGAFDDGVSEHIGRQTVKDWVEQQIPMLTESPIDRCEARFLQVANHHKPDFGVLVIHVPLSPNRPHWVRGVRDIAYIRAGGHSLPMSHRTLLDIASRTDAPSGRVVELGVTGEPGSGNSRFPMSFDLRPQVELLTGPVCQTWAVEVAVGSGKGEFLMMQALPHNHSDNKSRICLFGQSPMFPRQKVRIPSEPLSPLRLYAKSADDNCLVTVTLFAGSALPVSKSFSLRVGV